VSFLSAVPPAVVYLAKTFVVNYDIPAGSVLDSFSFFNSSSSAVANATITWMQPVTTNFAVQPTGPNSGMRAAGVCLLNCD
jgi:hypothetical protein